MKERERKREKNNNKATQKQHVVHIFATSVLEKWKKWFKKTIEIDDNKCESTTMITTKSEQERKTQAKEGKKVG